MLKEIAFLQVNDEKTKVPEHSPFKGDYVGWCYASQKYLACRVGCSERWIRDCVSVFEYDGVIETREWTDHLGYPHKEYHVIEDVVTAHQRQEDYLEENRDRPRRGGNKTANKGSFKKGNKARSHRNSQPLPQEQSAVSHRNGQPNAIGTASRNAIGSLSRNGTADSSVKDVCIQDEAPVASLPARPAGSSSVRASTARVEASAAVRRDGQGGSASASSSKTQNPNGNGSKTGTVTSGTRKPLPNKLCYPEAFRHCYDKNGVWIPGTRVPRCKRCDANLHPNENHVCEGYVPQLPFGDMEDHMELMDARQESMRDEIQGRREARLMESREDRERAEFEIEFGPQDELDEL